MQYGVCINFYAEGRIAMAYGSRFVCVIMPRAELPRHTVIVLSVSHSVCCKHFSSLTENLLKQATQARTRYLLGSELKKFGSKASLLRLSYGMISLP